LSIIENIALAAFYGQADRPTREQAFSQAREILGLVRLRAEPDSRVEGLGAAGLKKLELARALATRPKLLLADESLGGLDEGEMEQAADVLATIRASRGITIVWVEHIMGVLMRVVDRCVVLDHGEVIAEGTPESVAHDPRVVEVYLGTDAKDVQATVAARSG
jgi:branched-chain amino acid transport system ATP-binding protein